MPSDNGDNGDDIRVKQLLEGKASLEDVVDAATQAELQRWFELPSFQQVAEPAPVDAAVDQNKQRRARVMAAIDPALLDWIHRRTEVQPETLLRNTWQVELHVDPTIALFDEAMAERRHQLAEPRQLEMAAYVENELEDCTPQALLRDLHRPERSFDKVFEVVDIAAEQRFDIVAEVDQAMRTSLKLPPLESLPFEEEHRLLVEDRAIRRRPWTELRKSGSDPAVERTRKS